MHTSTGRISSIENGAILPSLTYIKSCKSIFHLTDTETIELFSLAYVEALMMSLPRNAFKTYENPEQICTELFEIIGIVSLINSSHHYSVVSELRRTRKELSLLLDQPAFITTDDVMGDYQVCLMQKHLSYFMLPIMMLYWFRLISTKS
jgi:hypothetical protein